MFERVTETENVKEGSVSTSLNPGQARGEPSVHASAGGGRLSQAAHSLPSETPAQNGTENDSPFQPLQAEGRQATRVCLENATIW